MSLCSIMAREIGNSLLGVGAYIGRGRWLLAIFFGAEARVNHVRIRIRPLGKRKKILPDLQLTFPYQSGLTMEGNEAMDLTVSGLLSIERIACRECLVHRVFNRTLRTIFS